MYQGEVGNLSLPFVLASGSIQVNGVNADVFHGVGIDVIAGQQAVVLVGTEQALR